jgi:hypothetical protein
LVRIYQRVFDIQATKTKTETLFVLKGNKQNPSRIRGLQKKYTPLVGRSFRSLASYPPPTGQKRRSSFRLAFQSQNSRPCATAWTKL